MVDFLIPRTYLLFQLKNLWDMEVTFIPIIIGALGTVTNHLIKRLDDLEIRRGVESTASLRSARILRRVQEAWEDLLSLSERPSATVEVKN